MQAPLDLTPYQVFGFQSLGCVISRLVKKFIRSAKALRRAGHGIESTGFQVELVCIKRSVDEEVAAADWSTCRRRGRRESSAGTAPYQQIDKMP